MNTVEVWDSARFSTLGAHRRIRLTPGIEPTDIHVRRFDAEDGGPLF